MRQYFKYNHSSIHPSIHPFNHVFICPSIHHLFQSSFDPSLSSISLSFIQLYTTHYPFNRLPSFFHPSITILYLTINHLYVSKSFSFLSYIYLPSIHSFIHPPIRLFEICNSFNVHPSSIHPSHICLFFHADHSMFHSFITVSLMHLSIFHQSIFHTFIFQNVH